MNLKKKKNVVQVGLQIKEEEARMTTSETPRLGEFYKQTGNFSRGQTNRPMEE